MTLNEIAENVAYALGDQFNETLKEAIKHTVIVYRAKLAKDDLARNFMGYTDYLQSFTMDLEKVDKVEGCESCKILRTIKKVPQPIRVPLGKSSFKYVGEVTGNNAFVYAHTEEYQFIKDLQYQHGVIYYVWENGYIEILNNLKLCKMRVEEIVADPRKINMSCADKALMFSDDREFPIPVNLLFFIEKGIINGDFPVITDGKEVSIEEEAK